jgi:dimethylargininase
MTTKNAAHFGPRLVVSPAGTLRAALLVSPNETMERAKPLQGEPNAIYARAVEQHNVLCATLRYFGVEVITLEAQSADAYEVSAIDAAVTFADGATIARPSAMSRRAEADRIQAEFARIDVPLAGHIVAPGLFDGSDVVMAGTTAFVGHGRRGNALGRTGFSAVARAHGYRVIDVLLDDTAPALASVLGVIANDRLVIAPEYIDRSTLDGFKVVELERGEELAAGVLCLGDGHVISDIRFRTSLRALRKAGATVEALDLYEFYKLGITPSMLALALKRD